MTRQGVQRLGGRITATAFAAALALAATVPAAGAQAVPGAPPSAAAMQAAIHQSRACLHGLPAPDRRLLILRFGIGGRSHLSDQAVAEQLGLTTAVVVAREAHAVEALASACGVAFAPPSATPVAGPSSAAQVAVARGSGDGVAADEVLAIALIVACAITAVQQFYKALFSPPPRT